MPNETTDFNLWLQEIDLDGYEEISSLYNTVRNNEIHKDFFSCEEKGSIYEVTSKYHKTILKLKSEKAKKYFLDDLENRFCNGLDMESWYAIEYNKVNDNS